jgi:hypothetical protein
MQLASFQIKKIAVSKSLHASIRYDNFNRPSEILENHRNLYFYRAQRVAFPTACLLQRRIIRIGDPKQ